MIKNAALQRGCLVWCSIQQINKKKILTSCTALLSSVTLTKGNPSHELPNINRPSNAQPENTLDHYYTTISSASYAVSHATLGHSYHVTVHLVPAYRQKLNLLWGYQRSGTVKLWRILFFIHSYSHSYTLSTLQNRTWHTYILSSSPKLAGLLLSWCATTILFCCGVIPFFWR